LIKKAVVESVRSAALLHSSSTQFFLPPIVRRLIALLLSIGPETHKVICSWLLQGCQIDPHHLPANSDVLVMPSSDISTAARSDPKALIRSICKSNTFVAELCKYLAAETKDIERSLQSILHSVISDSAALSTLLKFDPCSLLPPFYPS
jgi:hypothetical protein